VSAASTNLNAAIHLSSQGQRSNAIKILTTSSVHHNTVLPTYTTFCYTVISFFTWTNADRKNSGSTQHS